MGRYCWKKSGTVLLSRGPAARLSSALAGLTAVFGMGTGGTPPPWAPETLLGSPSGLPFGVQTGIPPRWRAGARANRVGKLAKLYREELPVSRELLRKLVKTFR